MRYTKRIAAALVFAMVVTTLPGEIPLAAESRAKGNDIVTEDLMKGEELSTEVTEDTEITEGTEDSGNAGGTGNTENSGSTGGTGDTENSGSTGGTGGTENSGSTGGTGDTENSGSTGGTGTTEESAASVSNLKAEYQESKGIITLTYDKKDCAYVRIYANGKVVEAKYTGTVYDFDEVEEGKAYTFTVEPYDTKDLAGKSLDVDITAPYKKASVEDVDVDYNLEKHVLVIDWEGRNIASADVYQDNVLIASKVKDMRYLTEMNLEALSKHTYRVVPYNKNDEAGTEKSYLLEVDDYVARLDRSNINYNETLKQITMNWDDTFTQYVDIYLNDEILVQKYTQKSYVYNCSLQPGATYTVSVVPYNFRNQEGEITDCDISSGYFEVPDEPDVHVTGVALKDASGSYTGFSKPAVTVKWEAQGQAVYEIYRAEKNKKSAYTWLATVKPDKDGVYTYTDEKVGISTYHYKIRRKIICDNYISQELYTALSDEGEANVSISKPTVKAKLEEDGAIHLTMSAKREYISGYDIYRKGKKGGYKKIASVTGDEYTDTEIEFGQTYYYKVKAFYYDVASDKKTVGKSSTAIKVKNTIGAIDAVAEAVSSDTVRLTWTAAANAEGYEIYFKSNTQGDSYVLWKTTESLSAARKLKKGGTYSFMIKAYRTTDQGKTYFSSAEVTYKMGFSAPQGLRIKKTAYQMDTTANVLVEKDTLSWKRVYGASGYYVDVYNTKTKKYDRIAKVKKSSNTSYTVTNQILPTAVTVKYRISAYSGDSVKKGETIDITPQLGMAEKVKAVKSGSKVKISWKRVAGAESYYVYRSNGRTMLLVGETTAASMTDKGLSIGASYKYYVQAVNKTLKLTGANSLPAEYMIAQKKVTGLKAVNKTAGSVTLSWKAVKNIQSYVIYYKTSPDEEYRKLTEVSAKKTSYVHTKQTIGTTCYYQIVAVHKNSGGVLVESAPVSAKVNIEK